MSEIADNITLSFENFLGDGYQSVSAPGSGVILEIENELRSEGSAYSNMRIRYFRDLNYTSTPAIIMNILDDDGFDPVMQKVLNTIQLECWVEMVGPQYAVDFVNRFTHQRIFAKLGLTPDTSEQVAYIPYKGFNESLSNPPILGDITVRKPQTSSSRKGWIRNDLVPNQNTVRYLTTLELLY